MSDFINASRFVVKAFVVRKICYSSPVLLSALTKCHNSFELRSLNLYFNIDDLAHNVVVVESSLYFQNNFEQRISFLKY